MLVVWSQKLSTESEGAQAHDFLQATFVNPTDQDSMVPAQARGSQGRRHLAGNGDLPFNNIVEDPKFPKGGLGSDKDSQQGHQCSTGVPGDEFSMLRHMQFKQPWGATCVVSTDWLAAGSSQASGVPCHEHWLC